MSKRAERRWRWAWALSALALGLGVGSVAAAEPRDGEVLIGRAASARALPATAVEAPLLVVINTPYEIFDAAGTLLHVAAWAPDGRPAAGAQVYLGERRVGVADEHGVLVVRWGVRGRQVEVEDVGGLVVSVRWSDGGTLRGGEVWFESYQRTESFATEHLYVHADRGVYAPGDVVQLRSIAWRIEGDHAPLTGVEVEYALVDPTGRVVAGMMASAPTDAYGVASSALQIPPSALEGVYELQVFSEGAEASALLRVEPFEAPEIEIAHTLGRFLTPDEARLAWSVTLGYFSGGAPARAALEVEVVADGAHILSETHALEGPGPHPMVIDGAALDEVREGLEEGSLIEVTMHVTDAQGRRDALTRTLRYLANPYVAVLERDRDAYSDGDAVELIARVSDRDRAPARGVTLRLETSRGETLTATTDAGGAAVFSLVMSDELYEATLHAPGVEAPVATAELAWQPAQPMRSHVAHPVLREGAREEVVVRFPAGFRPVEDVVHLDVVDTSGSVVSSVLLPIRSRGGALEARGTFEAPSWGSMLLTFFCLGQQVDEEAADAPDADDPDSDDHPNQDDDPEVVTWTRLGLMTEGQSLVVQPDRTLTITLDGVPDEAPPGAALQGRVRVTDPDGRAVDAALGVMVVDEAIISLHDPLEITPMDVFYNPELRVMATTGSQILTWPVVSRSWGDAQVDVALPPFEWLEGGEINPPGDGSASYGVMSGSSAYGPGTGSASSKPAPLGAAPSGGADASSSGGMALSARGDVGSAPGADALGGGGAQDPPPRQITIRMAFPETSLWLPGLEARDGEASFEVALPDAITRQQVTIVASDQRGGVGVLRQSLAVNQPLSARLDLPPTMTLGDVVDVAVSVRADEAAAGGVEVSLADATGALAIAPATQRVTAPPGGVGVARFRVEALRVGSARLEARASAARFEDVEQREVRVQPAGAPQVTTHEAALGASAPFIQALTVPELGQQTTVTLSVAFPALSGAFMGLDALRAQLRADDVMGRAADLVTAARLYQLQRARGDAPEETDALRQALEASAAWLLMARGPEGGWAAWYDPTPSPYLTGYVLDALLTMAEAGLQLPTDAIAPTATWLARTLGGDGLYDVSTIAFWEGDEAATRRGMSAELFATLARVPAGQRSAELAGALERLAEGLTRHLDEAASPEVLTAAHALRGLLTLSDDGTRPLDAAWLSARVARLDDLRREGHWEPSWFNAYGGTIEATVAVLEVLARADSGRFEAVERSAARYLLSTRDGWGGWHNPRGTAAAIRGLLLLGARASERPGARLEVLVDAQVVEAVAIDAADPFLSTMALRALDLSPHLGAGPHQVEVRYDGALAPHAQLILRHWPGPGGGETRGGGGGPLSATLTPTLLALGDEATLTVRLEAIDPQAPARLEVTLPANVRVDDAALEALAGRGAVAQAARQGATLWLDLDPAATFPCTVEVPVRAARLGEARAPQVTLRQDGAPGLRQAVAFTVAPEALISVR